ncbi:MULTISPECIES: D-erythronate dehydrogenase [unclassified Janthinobacterium]|uniref:D-erythronate dehydrogenase n=1 Tax=unclassified Janthinobacterium TaxID=2610881 RepID=UPI001E51ADBA|nr:MULTISPECIES: D-erythronate dehydrogenase [unclassified Janthinobacterium]MCC7645884.1 SDR family oxidoreductase [Janthinobacterium sp. EB271-G4-3-1]MCC7692771.1 SDR family oxidoreductase [Janthinobacterium sp. EB271-G4-3-2]
MKVLITGGAGFLGQRLARRLLAQGQLTDSHGQLQTISELVLVDVVAAHDFNDARVNVVTGDIADGALMRATIDAQTTSIFHLAAIVSGQAEADFELGMRINLDASRLLLDICRELGHKPKVVFTSSVAVYGGKLPDVVQDTTALNPQSSYGAQKAIGELLLNDYSRRGFVDGRVLRLPTISVRPGKPNKAASSFASGIIREPLNGEGAVCPVSTDLRLWLLSPRGAIASLIAGHELAGEAFGASRTVNLPGLSVSVGEMIAALEQVAGSEVTKRISYAPDPAVERIVKSWPGAWDTARAEALGLTADADFASIIRAYIDDVKAAG